MTVNRIKDMREDHDLSQEQIAKILFISRTAYSSYENGSRRLKIKIVVSLADYYQVSVDYLLGLTNNPKRNI